MFRILFLLFICFVQNVLYIVIISERRKKTLGKMILRIGISIFVTGSYIRPGYSRYAGERSGKNA